LPRSHSHGVGTSAITEVAKPHVAPLVLSTEPNSVSYEPSEPSNTAAPPHVPP
jgi:hypothetical protein